MICVQVNANMKSGPKTFDNDCIWAIYVKFGMQDNQEV